MSMYLSLYLSIYVCMYACMHVCMYVCMHASCIYDDRLFGGAHEPAMGGWEMAAGASRAQESQVRRKLPGGLGKGRACGWSCKSVQDVVGPNECLFVCPKPCFLFMAQPGLGGREGDSLGEWWVGAVGREMGTVALGWVAGACSRSYSKQAGKQGIKSGDVAFLLLNFGSLMMTMNYGVGSVSTLAKSCFIFGFWTGFTWFFPRKSGFRHTGSETTLISNYIEMILKSS